MKEFQEKIYRMDPLPPFGTCLFSKTTKPEDQNFLDMVRFTFFPYFGSYTFIFFYLILITFVFCYSLSWERTQEELNNGDDEFLRVSQNALFELGENYPYYIVFKFHYYRILTSMFLFRNFYQYILTALGILTFGSYIEQWVGFKRVFVLVVTCGATGQFFGNLISDNAKLQSTTPVCGLIGYLFGVYFMHRNRQWKQYQSEKNHMLLILLIMLGLYFHMGIAFTNVSAMSQLASLIFGFLFYFTDEKQEKFGCKSIIFIIILCVILGLLSLIFFFKGQPSRVYR